MGKRTLALPSLERLASRLAYDPQKGTLTWKHWKENSGRARSFNAQFANKEAGSIDKHGYRVISMEGAQYKAHRIAYALGTGSLPPPELEIDHINEVKSDNRLINLRLATPAQNAANTGQRKRKHDYPRGVHRVKRGKKHYFVARISNAGKQEHIGYFDSCLEAAKAAYDARVKLYGPFCRS
jgi:hypothetical protein